MTIRQARPEDIAAVRELFEEYRDSLAIDLCFQGFAAELAALPGAYAAPDGRLLLAELDGQAAGCVALRGLDEARCEMKRLYVRPPHRAAGLGRRLVRAALAEARSAGYTAVCLDTLPDMVAAQRLYLELGFRDIAPYYPNPVAGARFLGRSLAAGMAPARER